MGGGISTPAQLRPRAIDAAWWGLLSSTLGASSDAVDKWGTFADNCVDTEGQSGTYGGGACVRSAISATLMTVAAVAGVVAMVASVLKRDTQVGRALIYASGPFSLISDGNMQLSKRDGSVTFHNLTVELNGVPTFSVDAQRTNTTVSVFLTHFKNQQNYEKRDENLQGIWDGIFGLKYNGCHPDSHVLTSQYDWDAMWSRVDSNAGNIMSSYYDDIGIVDMNDKVSGNWQQLLSTGKLVLEQERNFGNNFEGCDENAFSQLARFS